jgi:hypothetical protein
MRLVGVLFAVAACGAPQFPLPMTAAQLAGYDSGPALVAYLGQPDAAPTVCDLRARGPHLSLFDDDKLRWLVRGLTDGLVAPELWRRCANTVLSSEIPDVAAALLDAVGRGYRALIRRSELETDPSLQARLVAAQRLYIERKNGIDGHARVDEPLVAELRRALDRHRLGPLATRMGDELIAAVDLEHGRWLDRPVDVAVIDQLFAAGDEPTLRRFIDRLPQAELRDAARRRVIRLHIAASPFIEVRQNAAPIEEQLVAHGNNPISLARHAPVRGFLDTAQVPWRGVVVRQQLPQQTATLLGFGADGPNVSVLPELKLRGALMLELGGVSRPVTLCAPRSSTRRRAWPRTTCTSTIRRPISTRAARFTSSSTSPCTTRWGWPACATALPCR